MSVPVDRNGLAAGRFVLAYGGGVLAGLVTDWLAAQTRRLIGDEPLLANTVSLVTPFASFLLAWAVHASGVLAVVVCGPMLNRSRPLTVPPAPVCGQPGSGRSRRWCSTGGARPATARLGAGAHRRHPRARGGRARGRRRATVRVDPHHAVHHPRT
ncbi:cation:proton antiporter domain-containing protein [Dactylosporangium sp. CA-233914]|uniref:cation:proton antiporter domain-containing protein n=1 Tax=Dactylosporangium sp. CA-233914 TaxID=3239934 RepID=UPI003D8EB15C